MQFLKLSYKNNKRTTQPMEKKFGFFLLLEKRKNHKSIYTENSLTDKLLEMGNLKLEQKL